MADVEKAVSASLCGLPLARASLAVGIIHAVIYGGIYFYEVTWTFADWFVLLTPPGLTYLLYLGMVNGMVSSEALLCLLAGVCLTIGAWKSSPGLILTWLIQQTVIVASSLLTLFYFLVAQYLKVPVLNCFFELFINAFQLYFLAVVYAHFRELRRGNLQEDNDHLVSNSRS